MNYVIFVIIVVKTLLKKIELSIWWSSGRLEGREIRSFETRF